MQHCLSTTSVILLQTDFSVRQVRNRLCLVLMQLITAAFMLDIGSIIAEMMMRLIYEWDYIK